MERQQGQVEDLSPGGQSQGIGGDDRWFYIEDCMGKT